MTDQDGRAWALQTLGIDGVRVRELVPEIVVGCHEKLANAQVEADMRHQGPYGFIWRRCLDEFVKVLGRLPSAEIVPVPKAGYSIVSFGGVALFPWRYARESGVEIGSRKFATSDTRVSIFSKLRAANETRLDLEFDHPELTDEEKERVEAQTRALIEVLGEHPRVIVVGYASNPNALHEVMWGEAKLDGEGHLIFTETESLMSSRDVGLVDVNSTESFADGDVHRAKLEVNEDKREKAEE